MFTHRLTIIYKWVFILLFFCLFSCASIVNRDYIKTKIEVKNPPIAVIQKSDTLILDKRLNQVEIRRSNEPKQLTFKTNDNKQNSITLEPKNSIPYYFNTFTYLTGFLLERKNPKRFTFPTKIKLDSNLTPIVTKYAIGVNPMQGLSRYLRISLRDLKKKLATNGDTSSIRFNKRQKSKREIEFDSSSYLYINTISQFTNIAPRWNIGYIKNLKGKFKLGLEIGYGHSKVSILNNKIPQSKTFTYGNQYQLWEIRAEAYLFTTTSSINDYFSLELFYIHHTESIKNSKYLPSIDFNNFYEFEKARFLRQKYGVNIKYGFIEPLTKKILFNPYLGVGVRLRNQVYRDVKNSRISFNKEDIKTNHIIGSGGYLTTQGFDFSLNMSFGLNLMFKL